MRVGTLLPIPKSKIISDIIKNTIKIVKIYINTLNLGEISTFLKRHNQPKISHEETNKTHCTISIDINSISGLKL